MARKQFDFPAEESWNDLWYIICDEIRSGVFMGIMYIVHNIHKIVFHIRCYIAILFEYIRQ